MPARLLLHRWHQLPAIDPGRLRADIADTCNPADFSGIDDLTVIAVPVPPAGA